MSHTFWWDDKCSDQGADGLDTTYPTSLFFGHAYGQTVAHKMYAQLKDDNIPIENLITLIWDGPNVNKTIMPSLQALMKEDYPDFSWFRRSLELCNSCCTQCLQQRPIEMCQGCWMDLHSLFKYSAACLDDFRDLQYNLGLDLSNFQQQKEVRWLSLSQSSHCKAPRAMGTNHTVPRRAQQRRKEDTNKCQLQTCCCHAHLEGKGAEHISCLMSSWTFCLIVKNFSQLFTNMSHKFIYCKTLCASHWRSWCAVSSKLLLLKTSKAVSSHL